MKKIVKAARTGELGINLTQRIVLDELGCMWYPTGGTECFANLGHTIGKRFSGIRRYVNSLH